LLTAGALASGGSHRIVVVWARCCCCGARLERWVTEDDAEADLLRSTLLAFEN